MDYRLHNKVQQVQTIFRLFINNNYTAKILKMRIFTKTQYFFDFCKIRSTYSEFSRRELLIGTNIVYNFSILFLGHILVKGGTKIQIKII